MAVNAKQCGCSEMHVRNDRVRWKVPETGEGFFSPIRFNGIHLQVTPIQDCTNVEGGGCFYSVLTLRFVYVH